MQPETQSGTVLRRNVMLDRYVITAREKISFFIYGKQIKGSDKGKHLAGKNKWEMYDNNKTIKERE